MIRVGKPMAPNTYAVYVSPTRLVEVVYARDRQHAFEWARQTYGPDAYVMENVQARDITW